MLSVRSFVGALSVASALFLAACDASHDADHAAESRVLTVVSPWEITNVDPSTSGFIYQRLGIGETLIDVDDQGNLIAGLATDWQSDDHKTWIFQLRQDVRFHDGTTLSADNVVQSLQAALTKPTALQGAKIQKISKIDDGRFSVELQDALPSFPAYLTHATALILASDAFDGDKVVKLIGTGPYQANVIEPPQKIGQSRFGDYWGQKAAIDRVDYLANSRSETRSLLVESASDHLVYTLDAASQQRLKNNPNAQVQNALLARTITLKPNAAHPFLRDPAVRRALSDAIDRKAIANAALRTENVEAYNIVPPMFAGYQIAQKIDTPNYAAIKKSLIDQGFSEDKNGMLQKDGKRFALTLITFSDRPELPLIATALQDQWRKIGLDLQVSIANSSETPKAHQDGSLELALFARNYGTIPDALATLKQDFDPKGADWGAMNYHNPDLQKALQNAENAQSDDEKAAAKRQVAQILFDDRPLIPVVYYEQSAAAQKNLQGLTLDPFERNYRLHLLR